MNPFKELILGITRNKKSNPKIVAAACSSCVSITITVTVGDLKEGKELLKQLGLQHSTKERDRLRDWELSSLTSN